MSAINQAKAVGLNHATEIPSISRVEERTAAGERARDYPFRFPRDRRQLGGKFSVEENGFQRRNIGPLGNRLSSRKSLGRWLMNLGAPETYAISTPLAFKKE